jgi:hypothetical protein
VLWMWTFTVCSERLNFAAIILFWQGHHRQNLVLTFCEKIQIATGRAQ